MSQSNILAKKSYKHTRVGQLAIHPDLSPRLLELADSIEHSVSADQLDQDTVLYMAHTHPVIAINQGAGEKQIIGGIRTYRFIEAALEPDSQVPYLAIDSISTDAIQQVAAKELIIPILFFSPSTRQGQPNRQWAKLFAVLNELFDDGINAILTGINNLTDYSRLLDLHYNTLDQYIESRPMEDPKDSDDDGKENN